MAFSSNWRGLSTRGRRVVSEGEIQREGRWKSDAYKVYTCNNTEDAGHVSRKLAKEGTGSLRPPGQDAVWGKPQR